MKQAVYILFACLAAGHVPLTAQENDSDANVVTILAVNDIHAAVEMFPRFAGVVDSLRTLYPDLLLFSGGDNRTGNPINDRHETPGYPITDLMNRLRFDASAVGNHEFDSKVSGFRTLIELSDFSYLCANIETHDSMRLHILPYRFFERDGVRIGVLGLIHLGSMGVPDAHPDNMTGIKFRPAMEAVKDYAWMRDQCDIFILLTHLGYDDDLLLADAFPEADIIIGGHSHTPVPNRVLRNGVIITQTERRLKYVTELRIEVSGGRITNKGHKLISVGATKQRNDEIQAVVDKYSDNETLNSVLTTVATPFENVEELGSLMADAQRAETNGDIALVNFGGVRYETYGVGSFTVKDAYMLDPFDNSLIAYEMTGAEVQQLIAAACEISEYPFVSGISYRVSFNADKSVKNITAFMPDGKSIAAKQVYRVIVNSYLSTVCPFTKSRTGANTFVSATSALIEYMKKQSSVSYTGVKRITIDK